MTTPQTPDEDARATALLGLLHLLVGTNATLDLIVPANEHAALTLSLRDWIALLSMMNGTIVFAKRSPLLLENELFQRGVAAYEKLDAQLVRANDAAAVRRRVERGTPP